MANQGQQGNPGQQGSQQGQHDDRDRDRESNIGHSGSDVNRPTGTSGQQQEPGNQPNRGNQPNKNKDEDDSGIGNRNTNR